MEWETLDQQDLKELPAQLAQEANEVNRETVEPGEMQETVVPMEPWDSQERAAIRCQLDLRETQDQSEELEHVDHVVSLVQRELMGRRDP